MWVGLALAAASLYSSYSQAKGQSDAARRQAQNNWKVANYNAQQIMNAGIASAQMTLNSGIFNANLNWMASLQQTNFAWDTLSYNLEVAHYTSEFNAQQLENEATEIWAKADLDVKQLHMMRAAEQGDIWTSYAASGVELNPMETPGQTMLDSKMLEGMDEVILRHNADEQAGRVLDAAAITRWEGKVARQQMLRETGINSALTMMNAFSRSTSLAMQSFMDSQMTIINSANKADSLLYSAYYDSQSMYQEAAYRSNPFVWGPGAITQAYGAYNMGSMFQSAYAAPSTTTGGNSAS